MRERAPAGVAIAPWPVAGAFGEPGDGGVAGAAKGADLTGVTIPRVPWSVTGQEGSGVKQFARPEQGAPAPSDTSRMCEVHGPECPAVSTRVRKGLAKEAATWAGIVETKWLGTKGALLAGFEHPEDEGCCILHDVEELFSRKMAPCTGTRLDAGERVLEGLLEACEGVDRRGDARQCNRRPVAGASDVDDRATGIAPVTRGLMPGKQRGIRPVR